MLKRAGTSDLGTLLNTDGPISILVGGKDSDNFQRSCWCEHRRCQQDHQFKHRENHTREPVHFLELLFKDAANLEAEPVLMYTKAWLATNFQTRKSHYSPSCLPRLSGLRQVTRSHSQSLLTCKTGRQGTGRTVVRTEYLTSI